MKALQLDPTQRYQTALELQVDLEDFAREARLPVSSARVGMFMRELFADEMAQEERIVAERLSDHGARRLGAVTRKRLSARVENALAMLRDPLLDLFRDIVGGRGPAS